MAHQIHRSIAEKIESVIPRGGKFKLLMDSACGGKHHLPLMITDNKSLQNRLCDVDLLIISDQTVRAIIEIEESGMPPTRICGKFFQSSIASFFFHDHDGQKDKFVLKQPVTFIQIIDKSGLPVKSNKPKQLKNIEAKIARMLPLKDNEITDYHLFLVPDEEKQLLEEISKIIKI